MESILKEKFGLSSFRLGQKEILNSILEKKDVLAVLPTGGGKSLCFQFPAVYRNQLVVVISPLISLMKDQVASLQRIGIPSGCLHSQQTEEEKRDVFQRISKGGAFVLYLSPERAKKEGFGRWIKDRSLALFAVDEAHCVSQWGHDFREEYGQLNFLKQIRPDVPILALTASATSLVLEDIAKNLRLETPVRHVHGFYRKNLFYQVERCLDEIDKMDFLVEGIRQFSHGRVIVYCGTRRSTEEVCGSLQKIFPKVGFYHAGLSPEERTKNQENFSSGNLKLLVATNAFGMGVDYPDVRLVVHFQMPANIDALYQEMGRAGRDGKDSTCLMLYSKKDRGLQSFFIQQSDAPSSIKKSRYNNLEALVNYAEGSECRQSEILTYYQDAQRIDRCGHCDSCDTESSRKVVKGKSTVPFVAKVKKRKSQKSSPSDSLSAEGGLRFSALKEWRKKKAKDLDVAAFMVFSDRTLRHLASANPHSLEKMRDVHGVGEMKLEAFGKEVLEILKQTV